MAQQFVSTDVTPPMAADILQVYPHTSERQIMHLIPEIQHSQLGDRRDPQVQPLLGKAWPRQDGPALVQPKISLE